MTTEPLALAAWLLERIAEDEATWYRDDQAGQLCGDPARVLAECAAKRAIVALHAADYPHLTDPECSTCYGPWPCPTLLALAQPYADAPGFREEWRT